MKNFLKLMVLVTAVWIVFVAVLSIIDIVPADEQQPGTHYLSGLDSFLFMFMITIPYALGAAVGSYLLYLLFRKMKLRSMMAGVLSPVLIVSTIVGVIVWYEGKNVTNRLFLLPEGYTGDVYIVYNVKGAPELEEENGYSVIPINEEGYYVTSTPDMDYGTVTDQYFYVDQAGNRTAIDDHCVSIFGTGGYQTSENEEIDLIYTGFALTQQECSEAFMLQYRNGELHGSPVMADILKEYYNLDHYY
ncbi:DUF6843 domain-containing protein [Jeotgalibacillus sp. JSM ZJ347]|uniref:DUF6843 domain-containing protein n=1 Tax=Jeotgalibacillus sp. JSM ZJ347 TaxID=3342117 RepID=UPI0035A98E10